MDLATNAQIRASTTKPTGAITRVEVLRHQIHRWTTSQGAVAIQLHPRAQRIAPPLRTGGILWRGEVLLPDVAARPSGQWRWGALAATTVAAPFGLQQRGSALLVMPVMLSAATISSVAGFAFSAVCGAMLFHIVDSPIQLVQTMIFCSLVNQAAMTWSLRDSIRWRDLVPFLAGAFPGLAPRHRASADPGPDALHP
jgi:hypothetical protein